MGRALTDDRRTTALMAILMLASTLPFLFGSAIQMHDAANHMARIHILAEGTGNADLMRGYLIHWRWAGNLGVDLPAVLLGQIMGIEAAVTIVAAITAPLTILGIFLLSRAAYGRLSGGAALALPLALSQLFIWGFLNYNLSIALALIVAARWRAKPPETILSAVGFGVAALVVWTSHLVGWGGMMLMIGGFELAKLFGNWRALPRRILIGLPLLVPLIPTILWRSSDAAPLLFLRGDWIGTKIMNFATILRGLSKPLDLGMTAIIGIAAVAALIASRRLDRQLGVAAILLVAFTLILPQVAMGSWGADLRITPWAVLVGLIAIAPAGPRSERALIGLGVAFLAVRIVAMCWIWHGWTETQRPQLALLDRVPRGVRLAYAYVDRECGIGWPIRPEKQIGSLSVVRRDVTANTLFVVRGADLVEMSRPYDRERWTNGSQEIHIADCPSGTPIPERAAEPLKAMAQDFDWIWIVTDPGIAPDTLPVPPGMARVASAPGSLLLRR